MIDGDACMPQVFEQMPKGVLRFLEAELAFFDSVTDISGSLYPVPKDERKAGAVKLAREVRRTVNSHLCLLHVFGRLWLGQHFLVQFND